MLSSSMDYRRALHDGKYLIFLEWIDFIIWQYSEEQYFLDADETMDLLIYEWLTHGFSLDDVREIAVLYAVYEKKSRPLREKQDYALTTLSNALFICMAYQKLNLYDSSNWQKKMQRTEIIDLIKNVQTFLDKELYSETLYETYNFFFEQVNSVDSKKVDEAYISIKAIMEPRYRMQDYVMRMESTPPHGDQLYFARLGVAKRLNEYLKTQSELTPEVNEQIVVFIDKIRDMQPDVWEEPILNIISPPTLEQNAWRWIANMGSRFFSIILPVTEPIDDDYRHKPGL